MHLEDQLRAGLDEFGLSWFCDERGHPGRKRAKDSVADVELSLRALARFGSGLAGLAHVHHDVMHDREITGARFESLNVTVLFEVGRYREVLIRDRSLGRDRELNGHLKYHVRFA